MLLKKFSKYSQSKNGGYYSNQNPMAPHPPVVRPPSLAKRRLPTDLVRWSGAGQPSREAAGEMGIGLEGIGLVVGGTVADSGDAGVRGGCAVVAVAGGTANEASNMSDGDGRGRISATPRRRPFGWSSTTRLLRFTGSERPDRRRSCSSSLLAAAARRSRD